MTFHLAPLPYSASEMEPHISAKTFEFHHQKHAQAYVTNLNNLIAGTEFEGKSLVEIIKSSDGAIFNNAAQIWNHEFFWPCLSKSGGDESFGGAISERINQDFGSLENFKTEFKNAAVSLFGSGWTFLVLRDGALAIEKYQNAENPISSGGKAIFGLDVWEHSYYLDYQNRRPDFVQSVLDHLINWDFASANLAE